MLIPSIGATGTFTISAPYNTLTRTNAVYEVKAVRRYADVINDGVDPYMEYYHPIGVDEATYQQHLAAGACIVSLVDSAGMYAHIPTPYITSYPTVGGVLYTAMLLSVDIGAVPNYLDLTALKQKLATDTFEILGVMPQIRSVQVSKTESVSNDDHTSIEANRVANITNRKTDNAKYLEAQSTIVALQSRLAQLEAYIRDNLPPTP